MAGNDRPQSLPAWCLFCKTHQCVWNCLDREIGEAIGGRAERRKGRKEERENKLRLCAKTFLCGVAALRENISLRRCGVARENFVASLRRCAKTFTAPLRLCAKTNCDDFARSARRNYNCGSAALRETNLFHLCVSARKTI